MKTAIVFPGQGSQSIGMIQSIAEAYPEIQSHFDEASHYLGYNLWQLVQEGPSEQLNQTTYTQPAILVASIAIWHLLQLDARNYCYAGHSLGEYSALYCAGAFSFKEVVTVVQKRAQVMEGAQNPGYGAMGAIVGLTDLQVAQLCDQVKEDSILSPANFNSPGQVVIAGVSEKVMKALEMAKIQGAKIAKLLPISIASHCELMTPAAHQLVHVLADTTISSLKAPVINNVNVAPYTDASSIRRGLVQQLTQPVRWTETIQKFEQEGVKIIIECGPGKVLTNLIKRIAPNIQLFSSNDLASFNQIPR